MVRSTVCAIVVLLMACSDDSGSSDDADDAAPVCTQGDFRACPCPGGQGLRPCLPDGSDFGPCECDTAQNTSMGMTSPAPGSESDAGMMGPRLPPPTTSELHCGNGSCEDSLGETCARCEQDCGACGESCDEDAGTCGPECGNGSCEPGEGPECEDCAGVEDTCGSQCEDDNDCAQPWTACLGGSGTCVPVECKECFDEGGYCCWCNSITCAGVSCVDSAGQCPTSCP